VRQRASQGFFAKSARTNNRPLTEAAAAIVALRLNDSNDRRDRGKVKTQVLGSCAC